MQSRKKGCKVRNGKIKKKIELMKLYDTGMSNGKHVNGQDNRMKFYLQKEERR